MCFGEYCQPGLSGSVFVDGYRMDVIVMVSGEYLNRMVRSRRSCLVCTISQRKSLRDED